MLKKDTSDKLKTFGFDVDKLIAAIKDEKEIDFEVPEVIAMTLAEIDARDATKTADGKKLGEKESRVALVKEVGTRLNITLKGERIADLVNEIQTEFNKTGDQKITTLQEQINLLTKDKESLTGQVADSSKAISRIKFENELIAHLPATRGKDLRDDERISLMNRDIVFEDLDGKMVAKRNGEIVKDGKTHAPLPVAEVVKSYSTERGWDKAAAGGGDGGRGGRNDGAGGGGGAAKKYSQVKDEWQKANPDGNILSPEFTDHVNAIAKADPSFDMYN